MNLGMKHSFTSVTTRNTKFLHTIEMARFALIALVSALVAISTVEGHGRMMKPPNRSSIWRVPEFASQNPPPNYSDNQLFCGGVHQENDPGTNCGVCGDAVSDPTPRENEINGKYYKGIITGRYTADRFVIDMEVDLTQAHLGNMEWRLCTNPSQETQACFNQHVLQLVSGGTKLQLEWNYRAGNNWGDWGDGSSATDADLKKLSVDAVI
ncbi:hypothetical protein Ocin01_13396 [Orchesella cincta]|uniref:Chitin-binding type-4 domain-containing protein n=1 Tax=Orchesella cincta TaxID=48709 RepID=A0A1D2MK65_ORCCI|nr:hypothetical protein Ocin01_13396 [Orchesella cincta]